jgi:hypothetical protein
MPFFSITPAESLAEGVVEQDASPLFGQKPSEVGGQLGHTALLRAAVQGPLRRDGEHHRILHQLAELALHVRDRLGLFGGVPDVLLRHHEHDLVAGLLEQLLLQERRARCL